MRKSESPPFYHLFDIPILFVFAPKGLVLSSKFTTSVFLSCVAIHLVPLHAHQGAFFISMTLVFVSGWQREKQVFFITELLLGLRRFVGALLTCLEPGEHIAQIFSMHPHNRSELLHERTIKMWRHDCGDTKRLFFKILLASLFELHFTSNMHRDRGLTWGEERLVLQQGKSDYHLLAFISLSHHL